MISFVLFQMNQKCKVCGEPAAGFHFGAFTCEGCKVRIVTSDIFLIFINSQCPANKQKKYTLNNPSFIFIYS